MRGCRKLSGDVMERVARWEKVCVVGSALVVPEQEIWGSGEC